MVGNDKFFVNDGPQEVKKNLYAYVPLTSEQISEQNLQRKHALTAKAIEILTQQSGDNTESEDNKTKLQNAINVLTTFNENFQPITAVDQNSVIEGLTLSIEIKNKQSETVNINHADGIAKIITNKNDDLRMLNGMLGIITSLGPPKSPNTGKSK
jgi:hypothetical protein